MNITPPPRFVARGVYGLCLGFALTKGSGSGVWLVTPCVILSSASLVLGYERCDLARRFGPAISRLAHVLPPDSQEPTTVRERLGCYLFVLIP